MLEVLKRLSESKDPEDAHGSADEALLEFINDPEITEAFEMVPKWYA